MMKFQVERTRRLFADGKALLDQIPADLAVDIELFSRGGSAILDRIQALGFDVLSSRPALTRWDKIALIWRAVRAKWPSPVRLTRRRRRADRAADPLGSGAGPASSPFEGRL
jgi:hypothetical protein